MFKKILLLLVVGLAGLAVYVATQPDHFRIERRATVNAPPQAVFTQVNDFSKWDDWSPWAKLDPNSKIAFEGPQAATGAVFKWSGNDKVGEGKMTVVESKPNDAVRLKVDFVKPFEGTSNSDFAFKPEGDGTAVTWTMSAHHNFIEKAFCLVMNGKKMIGDDLENGLAQMKALAEQKS